MAQFVVFAVTTVPAVGAMTHALVYRGDHADEAAAVAAGSLALSINQDMKVWACPVGSLTAYNIDVTSSRVVTLD